MAFIIAEFPETQDLSLVSKHLSAHQVLHRFILEANKQQLILINQSDTEISLELIKKWQAGDLPQIEASTKAENSLISAFANARPAPLTLSFVFLGFAGFALTGFGEQFIYLFTFWDSTPSLSRIFSGFTPWVDIQQGEIWRLITPVFLHFGIMHIVFNALWIWHLGTIVEHHQGVLRTLGLFILISAVSNCAQALMSSDAVIFGGLSGLVHGLFAYCWLWGNLNKDSKVQLQTGIFIVMTILMIASSTGIFDELLGVNIADTAHISGYISGLILAFSLTYIQRAGMNLGFK